MCNSHGTHTAPLPAAGTLKRTAACNGYHPTEPWSCGFCQSRLQGSRGRTAPAMGRYPGREWSLVAPPLEPGPPLIRPARRHRWCPLVPRPGCSGRRRSAMHAHVPSPTQSAGGARRVVAAWGLRVPRWPPLEGIWPSQAIHTRTDARRTHVCSSAQSRHHGQMGWYPPP